MDCELTGASDWKFVCFERTRILAMAHDYWSLGLYVKCQGKLNAIFPFEMSSLILIVIFFGQHLFFGLLQELTSV